MQYTFGAPVDYDSWALKTIFTCSLGYRLEVVTMALDSGVVYSDLSIRFSRTIGAELLVLARASNDSIDVVHSTAVDQVKVLLAEDDPMLLSLIKCQIHKHSWCL